MIGKVCTSVFPFYDVKTRKNAFKVRPILIIGAPDGGDYTVLPISRVTKPANVDIEYDIPLDPVHYPLLGLKEKSYIRVHKQTIVHRASIDKQLGDLKNEYAELYKNIMDKLEQFNKQLISNAL